MYTWTSLYTKLRAYCSNIHTVLEPKKMDGSSFHDWKGQSGHYPCQKRIGSIHQTKEYRCWCQNFNLQVDTCWIDKKKLSKLQAMNNNTLFYSMYSVHCKCLHVVKVPGKIYCFIGEPEIKPCGLSSRIWGMEAESYNWCHLLIIGEDLDYFFFW